MVNLDRTQTTGGSAEAMKNFQLSASITDKREDKYGAELAQYIESTITGATSYFFTRNNRFAINRSWASGTVDVQAMFQDLLDMNGKINYLNLDWKSIMMVNTIISRLVGRWMQRNERIVVTATDPLSVSEKIEQYQEAEFILEHREKLMQLQEASGMPLVGKDQFIPEDKDDLELWSLSGQKMPYEIGYEKGTNDILAANGWFDVIKEKVLHNSATEGLIGAEVWMDNEGVIHVEWINPANLFYSYSEFPDFRDTTWRGYLKALKISDLRKQYGTQFGGKLTEEQIWKIAAMSKEFQNYDKLRWIGEWNNALIRPYDEWNVDVMVFYVKSLDKNGHTITTTKQHKSTIIRKGRSEKLEENQEYVEDKDWNIYKGVWVRSTQQILEWGVQKNMIRPQDPTSKGDCEFPLSLYMYQNYGMRNIGIPEKIEDPVKQMILTRLKIQQVVAKMIPVGAAINVDAMQELDLGLASGTTSPIEAQKIWEQTGKLYYRGRDAEGNPIPVPFTEMANSGFITQMQGLIQTYQFHYQVLKDELGEDPNLMNQASMPRVAASNIQVSVAESDFATSYIYDAYRYLMADVAKKVCCLLKPSVEYGAKVYNELVKEEDMRGRVFGSRVEMLPSGIELQRFEAMLNGLIQANPDIVTVLDPFKLMRIAKEDVKLAERLMYRAQKKMIQDRMEQAQHQSEMNAKVQVQSMQAKAESDAKLKQLEGNIDIQKVQLQSTETSKNTVLSGIMSMFQEQQKTGVAMPAEMKALANIVLQNVALPALVQNQEQQQAIAQKMQQEAMMEQQMQEQAAMQQQQEQGGMPMEQEQPMPQEAEMMQEAQPQELQLQEY